MLQVKKEKILGQEFKVENQVDLLNKQMYIPPSHIHIFISPLALSILREKYIEEQIEYKLTGKKPEQKVEEKKLTPEEELYQTPAYLKVFIFIETQNFSVER